MRVLIIDDHLVILELMQAGMANALGHAAIHVAKGLVEALKTVRLFAASATFGRFALSDLPSRPKVPGPAELAFRPLSHILRVGALSLLVIAGVASVSYAGSASEPVIVFEKHKTDINSSHYKIEIYRDGSGVYRGFEMVKERGPIGFKIEERQVQQILDAFSRAGYWELAPDYLVRASPARGLESVHMTFAVRLGSTEKNVRFGVRSARAEPAILYQAIEIEVRSEQWRCPFQRGELEICEVERSIVRSMLDYGAAKDDKKSGK
jgi:hypothetical protein